MCLENMLQGGRLTGVWVEQRGNVCLKSRNFPGGNKVKDAVAGRDDVVGIDHLVVVFGGLLQIIKGVRNTASFKNGVIHLLPDSQVSVEEVGTPAAQSAQNLLNLGQLGQTVGLMLLKPGKFLVKQGFVVEVEPLLG